MVLSDVSESYEDMISREVENEINEEWHNTSKFNLFKRWKLFLMRWKIRKKKIEEMKKNYERTPFTNNGTFNREMTKQAARHDLEEILWWKWVKRDAFGKIDRKNMIAAGEVSWNSLYETARWKEFKQMCQDYVSWTISQIEFQNRFNTFVKVKLWLPKEQQFVATNVLEKLDAIKDDNELLKEITKDLENYLNDHNNSHFDAIRKKIDDDFKKFRRDPRFRAEILNILWNTAWLTKEQLDEKINKFIRHQKALAKMSTQNLQIKLDLLTNGKWAYQTNNKDRENWLFRFGNKLDKMPRWWQALTVAGISASGIVVGAATWSALAATLTLSGLVWAKNAIKKYTHHTKEQNTYEKNLTRNYEEEIAKMKEWERIRTEKDSEWKYTNSWFKRYRAKRQLELYWKTTQVELQNENTWNTRELSNIIYSSLERYDTLNPDEKNALNCNLLDAKARLESYWAKWHNFLKSKNKNQIERDFYDLENALNLSANRILGSWTTLKEISQIRAFDASWNEVNYNDLLDLDKKDYNSATKKFRWERAWLATKWGISTAAITFGTSAAVQYATWTGMFAKEAVAWTPWTPDSHETLTANGKDYYWLWKYETSDSGIFKAAQDNIAGLESWKDWITYSVKVHLSSGTDGTQLAPWSSLLDPRTYQTELQETINAVKNSCLSNKDEIISHLEDWLPTNWFTNHALYSMRDLNAIEQIATGSGKFNGTMEFIHDVASWVDWHIAHDATSRFTQAAIEITKTVAGQPWTDPVEGGTKWLVVGLPWFSNTFKRNNDGKPEQKPVAPIIDEPNDKPSDKPVDKPNNKWDDKWKNKWDDHSPEDDKPKKTWPKPVDPKKNPDDVHKDDEPKPEDVWKKVWEVKWIVTRWQKINKIDDSDLWIEYPGDGKMLTPMQAAANLIICHWEDRENKFSPEELERIREHKFSPEDIKALSSISDKNEQIIYLAKKIEEDRTKIENSEEQQALDRMLLEIEEDLPRHLKDIFWDDYKYLNAPMSKDRIHLVDNRDFLAMDCNSKDWTLWVFRSKEWDIYISQSFLEESGWLSWNVLYREGDVIYPELYFNIIHTVVHEMIHSMSAINYFDTKKGWNKSDYFPRRVGLKRVKITKAWELSAVDWWWFNEAATESLAWEIVSRWHKPYNNPRLKVYMCYKDYINIIEQMEKIDGVKKLDFWKAMLIRKRSESPDSVEKNTPLFELVKKINWKDRPKYYDLIMNSMDKGIDSDHIVQFIKTKNIKYLKDWLPFDRVLSDVFDKNLLTKNGLDFKKEILDVYPRS